LLQKTTLEINPQVITACRLWFKLPPDDAKLEVVLADAALEIQKPQWQGQIDALQVDLYDHEAATPVLDSAEFYANCRNLLTDDGVMTVNLFGRSSSFQSSVDKITEAFGTGSVWAFKPTREGNTIVLALRTASTPKREALMARAEVIQAKWGLPATKWLRVFKQL
jgi:spermidine synthase